MRKHCFGCGCLFHATRANQLFCSPGCRYRHYHSNTLVLPIKKIWFDMILAGEKTEEYRERKDYWETRFKRYFRYGLYGDTGTTHFSSEPKAVIFRNGYQKEAPEFTALVTVSEKEGRPEWGAEPGVVYYALRIHEIYNRKNC